MKNILNKISKQTLFFISLIGIVVVSLTMLTTFAYQSLQTEYNSDSKKGLTVNAGVLDVTFAVTNRINETNLRLLDNYKTASYSEFTIDNTKSSEDAAYKIKLVDLEYSESLKISDFKYTITKVNDNGLEIISEGDFSTLSTTEIELSRYMTIKKASIEKVRLYLWIKNSENNQNNLKNSSFKGIIQIESMFDSETPTLKNTILKNAKSATGERTTYQEVPLTLPGEAINTEAEKTLSKAEDDYGDSYYFRGNVIDNYVNFAGMCWRIVRIAGDSSIKLILEDQDELCSEAMDGNWNIPTETGGTIKKGNFGYTQYDIGTLTASDGTTNSSLKSIMNYLNGKTNNITSMAYAFKNFQEQTNNNNKSLKDKIIEKYDYDITKYLKSGDWCLNNKAFATLDNNEAPLSNDEILDRYVKNATFYYDSYIRLNSNTLKKPTFKCNSISISNYEDNNKTNMYVGTLTVDEITFIGLKLGRDNINNYLINKYQQQNTIYFWSLSYGKFSDNVGSAFGVHSTGNVTLDSMYYSSYFRPAIALATNVEISNGDGTINNAYEIR